MKYVKLAAAFVILMLLFSCAAKPDATCLMSGGEAVFALEESGFALYDKKLSGKLSLYNGESEELKIYVYSAGGGEILTAAPGETVTARAPSGKLYALRYVIGGADMAYSLTGEGISALIQDGAESISLLRDAEIDGDLVIDKAVDIDCTEHKLSVSGNVVIKTKDAISINLFGDISAEELECNSPDADICAPDDILPKFPHLTLLARSVNGKTIAADKRVVSSMDELKYLAELDMMGECVVLSGFEVTERVVLTRCDRVVFDGCEPRGLLEINGTGNILLEGEFAAEDVKVASPEGDLTVSSPVSFDEAGELYDVKSYCGFELSDYELGGEGDAEILSAKLSAEGSLMTDDIEWTADGYILSAEYAGVAAPEVLRSAELDFDCEDRVTIDRASISSEGRLDLLSPFGCYVNVTDEEGNVKKYKVETDIKAELPVVVIETDGSGITKEEYSDAVVSVECDHLEGFESTHASETRIRGRGNSTWKWSDKKPYKLKFDSDVSLLGMREGREWVLLANYNDKALIRNYVALEMAKTLDNMDCYATQYPVDVFLDGKYVGVYTLGEQIEEGDERIEIGINATTTDTGYLLEVGGEALDEDEISFSCELVKNVQIIEPKAQNVTDEHIVFISNYIDMVDRAIISGEGYDSLIDVDSLIDWFILTELSFNSDGAMRRSVFLKKNPGEKLEIASVWDYDIAFGNSNTDFLNYHSWACLATDYGYVTYNWMNYLMKDEAFVARLRERFNEIKDELHACAMDSIDYAYEVCAPSAEENFQTWDILNMQVAIEPYYVVRYNTYEKQIEFLREFINFRFEWIDSQLNG